MKAEKKSIREIITQFIKFGIVGLSNTGISLAIYYVFIFINKDLYIVGNTVGFFVSVLNAYYWNHKYVFKSGQKGHFKPLLKTFTAYGSTFLLSTVLLYVMVNLLHISEIIAPLLNLLITIPLNFLLNKFWAMK
ncbi:MAG: GtrA family protein [Oscillospiraceae bacterium]